MGRRRKDTRPARAFGRGNRISPMEADDALAGAVEAFRRLGRASPVDVFEGALLVSLLIDPEADVRAARERVEELAARVAERRSRGESPLAAAARRALRGGGIRRRFRLVRRAAELLGRLCPVVPARDADHAFDRRAGSRRAARASSSRASGCPGHFVLGGADLPEGLFLDPFEGGTLCDAEALRAARRARSSERRSSSPRRRSRRTRRWRSCDGCSPTCAAPTSGATATKRRWGSLDCAEALEPGGSVAPARAGHPAAQGGRPGDGRCARSRRTSAPSRGGRRARSGS